MPAGTPLQVAESLQVAIGEDPTDMAHVLHGVGDPFLLPGGLLAVPVSAERVTRVFDGDGVLVETYGGEGEGPGEFVARSATARASSSV